MTGWYALMTITTFLSIFVFIVLVIDEKKYSLSDDHFTQKNATVNFYEKTLTVKNRIIPISSIHNLTSSYTLCGSTIYIVTNDINNPIVKVRFMYRDPAEIFLERLRLALNKAGGKLM